MTFITALKLSVALVIVVPVFVIRIIGKSFTIKGSMSILNNSMSIEPPPVVGIYEGQDALVSPIRARYDLRAYGAFPTKVGAYCLMASSGVRIFIILVPLAIE